MPTMGWMRRCLLSLGLAGAMGVTTGVVAGDYDAAPLTRDFIAEMSQSYGFAPEQLQALFGEVERKQAILDAISRPAERVKPQYYRALSGGTVWSEFAVYCRCGKTRKC